MCSTQLCDLGSAFHQHETDNVPTPYLQSRWYRAPEVVLLERPTMAADMWSVACCLFEIYTGDPLFRGNSNNEMLFLFCELRGAVPKRMVRRHLLQADAMELEGHFEEDGRLKHVVQDPVRSHHQP